MQSTKRILGHAHTGHILNLKGNYLMKKIFAILAMVAATSAMADSATVEYANVNNIGSTDQKQGTLSVKHDFSNTLAGDVLFSNTQTDGTNALSTRLEAGVTASQSVMGIATYVRGAAGQKFTNTASTGYYSVEPGVILPYGAFTVKAGYRFRTPTDQSVADQTRTARLGVSYALTKQDSVGVRLDRVHGDSTQNIAAFSYTRGF
jgi:hypothetical protein